MGRSNARELMRAAQAAEIDKDYARAAALLKEAAQLRVDAGELGRAVPLLRHCLRLAPDDAEAQKILSEIETDEPSDEEPPRRLHLDLPQRGPTAADPELDCWCSFCCRPKDEVGAMVAGPAGAFICAACIRSAARLVGAEELSGKLEGTQGDAFGSERAPEEESGDTLTPIQAAAHAAAETAEATKNSEGAENAEAAESTPAAEAAPAFDFIEAAVRLSRSLGWSLDEVRSLGDAERRRALEVLERLGIDLRK